VQPASPDEIRRRCEESCLDQGTPVLVEDPLVLAQAAAVVRPTQRSTKAA